MHKIKVQDWSRLRIGELYYVVGHYSHNTKRYWIIEITKPDTSIPNRVYSRTYPSIKPIIDPKIWIQNIKSQRIPVPGAFYDYGQQEHPLFRLNLYRIPRSVRKQYRTIVPTVNWSL